MQLQVSPSLLIVVALALADGAGRWLMQRRPQHKQHGGLWEFPGGKVELGEALKLALVREISEELNIMIAPAQLKPCGFAENIEAEVKKGDGSEILLLLYKASKWDGQPESMEGGEVGWFSPEEILKLDKPLLDCELAAHLFSETYD